MHRQKKKTHTVRFLSRRRLALGHLSFLFEIQMPTLRRALLVLQRERENSVALLDRVFPLAIVRLECAIDRVECFRGGECICALLALNSVCVDGATLL